MPAIPAMPAIAKSLSPHKKGGNKHLDSPPDGSSTEGKGWVGWGGHLSVAIKGIVKEESGSDDDDHDRGADRSPVWKEENIHSGSVEYVRAKGRRKKV